MKTFENFAKRGARTVSPPALPSTRPAGGNGFRICILISESVSKLLIFHALLLPRLRFCYSAVAFRFLLSFYIRKCRSLVPLPSRSLSLLPPCHSVSLGDAFLVSHCLRCCCSAIEFLSRNVFDDFSTLRKVEKLSSSEHFSIIVLLVLK